MKTFLAATVAISTLAMTVAASAAEPSNRKNAAKGPVLLAQDSSRPQLGQPGSFEVPPPPAPFIDNGRKGTTKKPAAAKPAVPNAAAPQKPQPDSVPAGAPSNAAGNQKEAMDGIVQAENLLRQGNYEDAIRFASRSIALDADNSAAYKKIRATAYLRLGRYEEALADVKPLEVTVTAQRAEIKTKRTVLAVVEAGTKVMIDDAKGEWLKVASIGGQKYDWAWIHQRDVRLAERAVVTERPAPNPNVIEYNPPSLAPTIPGVGVYIYAPGAQYNGYGRAYYDYWQHVPAPYRGFLPR